MHIKFLVAIFKFKLKSEYLALELLSSGFELEKHRAAPERELQYQTSFGVYLTLALDKSKFMNVSCWTSSNCVVETLWQGHLGYLSKRRLMTSPHVLYVKIPCG